jgi:hypothetical protein
MLQPRILHAVIAINQHVYVFGGYNFAEGNLISSEIFGTDENSWNRLPNLTESISFASVCRKRENLYITGFAVSSVCVLDLLTLRMTDIKLEGTLG